MQRVDDSEVAQGVGRGVGADEVAVAVEDVIQVVVVERAFYLLELEAVRDGSEVMSFLVFEVEVLLEQGIVRIDERIGVDETHVEAGEDVGDVGVAGIAVGEGVVVAQAAVFFKFGVVENVADVESVNAVSGLEMQKSIH